MPEVVFHYLDQTKRAEKDVLLCLKRYSSDYIGQDRILLRDSCNFAVFCHFIDFLVSGYIPNDKNDQIGVINLLKEWESHFGILDSFRFRLSLHEKNGIIVYNGKEYTSNIGCWFLHSRVFREFYTYSPGMVFHINLSVPEESFDVFLDLMYNRISYPKVENVADVYEICKSLGCESLCQLLNDESCEQILSIIMRSQNDENFDISQYEHTMSNRVESFIKFPSFCLMSIPSLCRIFGSSNQTFSLSSLETFLTGCMKHHGTGAKILLNNIKYQSPSDLSELKQFLQIMSIGNSNDIYDNTNQVLSSFQREFSEIRNLSERNLKMVNDMNSRLENQDKVIQELKSAMVSANATIGEQNNIIQEKDSLLAEKIKMIQENEVTINEKIKQIKDLSERDEYAFHSDLFSGIFDGLSKKLGRNLADSNDIDVTASSVDNGSYDPKNVLKNDSSRFQSQNTPNSWIQFDFKIRKVSITSYSLNDENKVKSWKVEGSQDGSSFEIIDNKVDSADFQNCSERFNDPNAQKNFPVNYNNKYYRYIRITSTGKDWRDTDHLRLFRIELFGYVTKV